MHVLISPNAFKNSLDATSAAEAIAKGLQQSSLECTTTCFPIGDGGDGTGRLLTQLCGGSLLTATVHDPLGRKIDANIGLTANGQTAIIEMADASGLRLLKEHERDPLHASSFGTGELLLESLNKNVQKIILCIGGSATVDGGCGILKALGARFLDKSLCELQDMPGSLIQLSSIDLSTIDQRIYGCEIVVLCDVANTLLGENGSAKIFGPQKGASEKMVEALEASLMQLNKVVRQSLGIDMSAARYGGAAGGVAASLNALLHARLVNGIDYFLDMTGFDEALQQADLLITGEGSIDLQTLDGKAPYGVAVRAEQKHIPVIAMAGRVPAHPSAELNKYFHRLININHENDNMGAALTQTSANLTRAALALGDELAGSKSIQ